MSELSARCARQPVDASGCAALDGAVVSSSGHQRGATTSAASKEQDGSGSGSFLDSAEFAAKLERRRSMASSGEMVVAVARASAIAAGAATSVPGAAVQLGSDASTLDESMSYLEQLASRIAARQAQH